MTTLTTTHIKLDPKFIAQTIQDIQPHWGPLGWVTYKRTYARWLPEKGRTENWAETVQRVVEGNINLDPRLHDQPDFKLIKELTLEAQQLFKLIYGLAATPSGRNLWISGTDYQKRNGDALNNCWFIAIRPQAYGQSHIVPEYLRPEQIAVSMPFSFLFDQLMKGGGVGFSVVKNNICQMPAIDQNLELTVLIDSKNKDYQESCQLGVIDKEQWLRDHSLTDSYYYELPDTREGWVLANARVIDFHFNQTNPRQKNKLVLDISNIRPRGERIKGFGGTASGPMPLIEMLFDINTLLNHRVQHQLSAVDCTDICNLIGKTVVAGNVRRSAELALGSGDDADFITMKQDQTQLYHHRWASNNSINVTKNLTNYQPIADAIQENGEPGIVNLNLSQNYGRIIDGYHLGIDKQVEGTNPCGEISLANGEPCNLFEVFPYIAEKQNWDLTEAFTLATRYTKRVTFSKYDWEISRQIIQQNRRIGVSMSGIQDWILSKFGNRVVTGFNDQTHQPIYDQRAVDCFNQLYQAVIAADQTYSQQLHCHPSIKHTTVKPSGTVAKLAGVSEGMHFHYAGYLIQRIRFQDSDPLLQALQQCGYRMEPDIYTEHTICVEFPVKAPNADNPNFASAGSVSIAEQFATQAFLQTYWSDNAVSCTVTFQNNEVDQIAPLLEQYRQIIKSTSLLPYYGGSLKQAPKEPITQAQYQQKQSAIDDNVNVVFDQIQDQQDLELVDQSDCAGGACPIK